MPNPFSTWVLVPVGVASAAAIGVLGVNTLRSDDDCVSHQPVGVEAKACPGESAGAAAGHGEDIAASAQDTAGIAGDKAAGKVENAGGKVENAGGLLVGRFNTIRTNLTDAVAKAPGLVNQTVLDAFVAVDENLEAAAGQVDDVFAEAQAAIDLAGQTQEGVNQELASFNTKLDGIQSELNGQIDGAQITLQDAIDDARAAGNPELTAALEEMKAALNGAQTQSEEAFGAARHEAQQAFAAWTTVEQAPGTAETVADGAPGIVEEQADETQTTVDDTTTGITDTVDGVVQPGEDPTEDTSTVSVPENDVVDGDVTVDPDGSTGIDVGTDGGSAELDVNLGG